MQPLQPLMRITSRDNNRIKRLVKLLSRARERTTTGLFVSEGARLCGELVLAQHPIEELFLTPGARKNYPEDCDALVGWAKHSFEISENLAEQMSDTASPQGIFAVAPLLDNSANIVTIRKNGQYLLLDNLQDPGNVGTILRTAAAFGVDGVWMENSVDIYSPKVLRATMGGLFRLPIILQEDLTQAILRLQANSVSVWAAALNDSAKPVSSAVFTDSNAIVIGNEGAGLTPERIQQCTGSMIIPMAESTESLNASIAAGILLWEMSKIRPDTAFVEQ